MYGLLYEILNQQDCEMSNDNVENEVCFETLANRKVQEKQIMRCEVDRYKNLMMLHVSKKRKGKKRAGKRCIDPHRSLLLC